MWKRDHMGESVATLMSRCPDMTTNTHILRTPRTEYECKVIDNNIMIKERFV